MVSTLAIDVAHFIVPSDARAANTAERLVNNVGFRDVRTHNGNDRLCCKTCTG